MARIVIRVDSSMGIGSGHLMRCLTLATALQDQGHAVCVVCRPLPGHLSRLVEERGLQLRLLPPADGAGWGADAALPAHAAWLGTSWQLDAEQTVAAIAEAPVDWLIVDHYALDARWERALRAHARQIMVIDDLADRPHDCDLLLDHNLGGLEAGRYEGLLPPACVKLMGPRYALLRPEFASARAARPQHDGSLHRILLFMGGADPGNESAKALQAFRQIEDSTLAIDLVIGAANPHAASLQALAAADARVSCHYPARDMGELMVAADLAIGAGGVTQIERCVAGLPSLLISVADNQVEGCRLMARRGAAWYAGPSEQVDADTLAAGLRQLAAAPDWLAHMADSARALADGLGTSRIVAAMAGRGIVLRTATPADSRNIWEWRNHEDTRRHSGDGQPIPWEGHEKWFATVLQSSQRHLLIGEDARGAVGVLRFDRDGDAAVISIYLVPGRHGQGLGSELIAAGTEWARRNLAGVRVIHAEVRADNLASAGAFVKAGYSLERSFYLQHLS
ncbi:MAG TPA: UDP-2,4-diacetamido-2,4,6-trideoxy-beta-L-altropyranose hydrolase [Solimonas sp.]|nr:UDP-2,4-diacetamido-2,4,6-trideoxy-beta-L-altropyranose hydrolase [Solimonas sp.]